MSDETAIAETLDRRTGELVHVMLDGPMSALDVKRQVNLIQDVMASVMRNGEHYGVIPGCGDKPTLLKAGAEKLMLTFRLAPKYVELQGSREEDGFIVYKIQCDLVHAPTGNFVGSGIGACNSQEKKYRERSVYADKATEEEKAVGKLVEKISKAGNPYQCYIIPQNPWDLQNTLYKMACKRALVAAILNVTAASDIFTQDIEDMDPATITKQKEQQRPENQVTPPQRKSETAEEQPQSATALMYPPLPKKPGDKVIPQSPSGQPWQEKTISDPQGKRLFAIWKKAGLDDNHVKDYILREYGYNSTREIKVKDYEAICDWAGAQSEPGSNG